MDDLRVIRNSNQQYPGMKSMSDHKTLSSKQKITSDQQIIDSNRNEGNAQNSNLKLKSTDKLSPKTNESGKVQTIRKCLRKGSRICYTDMENITVLRKIPEKITSKISFVSNPDDQVFEKVDSYRSGESLFKTFTFEQTRDIDDPETVKCIEFWKSVMKKNLAPIKCTLLESDQKQTVKKKEKNSISKDKSSESKKSLEKTEKLQLTGDGARIWSEALKEIRKKKLDQLKLYVQERCQYCTDPFTRDLKDSLGFESSEDVQAEIMSLNAWKPVDEQIDLMNNLSKPSLRKRMSLKSKKMSTTQTVETRMNEQTQKESTATSKARVTLPGEEAVPETDTEPSGNDKQDPPKKLPSILKSSSKMSQHKSNSANESSKKMSTSQVSSAEVQAPTIKCPCESDTCLCPHRAAARNSRTSFVEIARKNMLQRDGSTEKFFPNVGEPCVCHDFTPNPWLKVVCPSEVCPEKFPKVKVMQSSSDFDLTNLIAKDSNVCVCTKNLDVVCPSRTCKNKLSQGSLIEGFPEIKKGKDDSCVCDNPDSEAPCTSDVCPTKTPKESSKTCVCASNSPWSQAICRSWKCSYHKKIKMKDTEEKIKFRGHPPIKEVTSTCTCQQKLPWNETTCHCEVCAGRTGLDSILKVKDKKATVLKTTLRSKSSSKELMLGRKVKSKEKIASATSLDKMHKEKEKARPKTTTVDKTNKCVCSSAPPWKIVSCNQKCVARESGEKNKTNLTSPSVEHASVPREEDCICNDDSLEPTCKVHKCKNKEVSIEYPPPCICPQNLEETKHEHFKCVSETCKMKKIDKTCLCRLHPDAPCDAKTCVSKPQPLKTLKESKKYLRYNPKCICKVRGLPTTQEVSCVAPECPFQRKHPKMAKKMAPKLFTHPSYEHKSPSNEPVTKCICSTKDASISVKCRSVACKKKNKSGKSQQSGDIDLDYYDEDNSEQEVCICKNEQTDFGIDQEIICNQIQCPKTSVGDDGAVMNDKCVCANLDQPCDEPTCTSTDETRNKICSEILHKPERPYCYICGHFDCLSMTKRSEHKQICKETYNDTPTCN